MCGIVVCLSVPVLVRICIGLFIAGCQGYLLASRKRKKQNSYRLAAVLGVIGFLLGMTRSTKYSAGAGYSIRAGNIMSTGTENSLTGENNKERTKKQSDKIISESCILTDWR